MDILSILQTIVTYIYIPVAVIMILIILLQSGKGGLGTALGGGASQSVFGGGGASEFMAKVTQALAFGFMICCVFLAYAGAHSGSSRLKSKSEALSDLDPVVDAAGQVNYERIGPNPQVLPKAGGTPPAELPVVETPDTPEEEPEAAAEGNPADGAPAEGDAPAEGVEGAEGVPAEGAPTDGASAPTAPAEEAPKIPAVEDTAAP